MMTNDLAKGPLAKVPALAPKDLGGSSRMGARLQALDTRFSARPGSAR